MKLFTSATLAVSATLLISSLAHANGGNENPLSIANTPFPSLSMAGDGPSLGGYILVHYGDDADGAEMKFRAVRMEMKGTQGAVKYAVSADFNGTIDDHDGLDNEAVSLKDANVAWEIYDGLSATFGRFKEPVLHTGIHSSSRRLMVERTNNGSDYDSRNAGFMLNGSFGDVQWWAAMQEGGDGAGAMDETQTTIRAVYNVMGSAFGKYQGAYGYEGQNLSIGVASIEDNVDVVEKATAMEVGYASDGWSVYADMVAGDDAPNPTSITVSRLMNTEYEIAVRMEEEDDADDTSRMTAGVNWYHGGDGHNLKWQLNFTDTKSDDLASEGSRVDFGLVWRF
jgi:hypothetical protein